MINKPHIDSSLQQHSLALTQVIKDCIQANNSLSFAEFMHKALYQPGLGYYSSGMHKFGQQGDFITAPELGDLFAKCLAQQFQQVLQQLENPIILELGAGTGQFCYDCLLQLGQLNCLPQHYYILEVSADLQHRQQQTINQLPEHLHNLVTWIQQPPTEKFKGIIFANEVLDALPVEVFKYANHHFQQLRIAHDAGFKKIWQPFPDILAKQLLAKNLALTDGYESEFIPHLSPWLHTISENLTQGVVIFVDYGYEQQAYYHPQRNQGTLVCYHQHQANYDYFNNIGLQDITAFVDFTAVAEAADSCGLSVAGYTTQAHFLLSLNIQQKLGDAELDFASYYQKATELKKLTLPNEMGEKFKVIALSKNFEPELSGFSFANALHLL